MTEEIKEKLDLFPDNMNDIAREAYYELLNYITNLQQENEILKNQLDFIGEQNKCIDKLEKMIKDYKQRNEKAIEYIKKDTRWFDSEYAKIYGILCDCEGAKGDRLEVLVNPTNLLNILKGGDE